MIWLWISIAAAGVIIDIATSSILFVGFSVGGISALISLYLGVSVVTQFTIFLGISLISLSLIYPLITKKLKKTIPKTVPMEKNYVGRRITVNEDIIDKSTIKLDGIYWTVKKQGSPIYKGNKAVICGIEGNKLILEKIEEDS